MAGRGFQWKRRLYEEAPGIVRWAIGATPFSLLAGPAYRRTTRRARHMDRAPLAEVRAWQERALGNILEFAAQHVPAYQPYRSIVSRMRPFEALRALPLLNRQDIQQDPTRYLADDISGRGWYETSTGGTTGGQLRIILDDDSHAMETAFIHRLWSRVGYTTRCRKATFRGVEFRDGAGDRHWQANPIYREVQFSPFHMNDRTMSGYVQKLAEWKPHFIHGYPSAVATLATFMLREGLPALGGLRGVLLGSEAAFPEQRDQIQRALGARVYTWYGHSERVILAGECEHSTAYHQCPDYGLLEIVNEAGDPVEEGEMGELVGTGFWNRAMPLIRYRTGDLGRRLSVACECGRNHDRFDQVEGRWKQEYVVGLHGARVSTAALNMHGPLFDRVLRYQYFQDRVGTVELRIMPAPGFGEADVRALADAYNRRLSGEATVIVRTVDDIPLTPRGKIRRLIQQLPPERCDSQPKPRVSPVGADTPEP